MEKIFEEISVLIEKEAERFEQSGAFGACLAGKPALSKCFGPENRMTGAPITENTRYLLSADCKPLLGIIALILADMKKLSLNSKLSRFIPEYKHANEITIKQLFTARSGVRDYLFGEIAKKRQEEPSYAALSDEDKKRVDAAEVLRFHSFEEFMEACGEKDLEFKPGLRSDYSESEVLLLRETLERAAGMDLGKFAEKHIFRKLGMDETLRGTKGAAPLYCLFRNEKYMELETEGKNRLFFTTTARDLMKLCRGIFELRLFSEKMWQAATKFNSDGEGICFYKGNGTIMLDPYVGGIDNLTFFYDEPAKLCYFHVSNAEEKYIMDDGVYTYFFQSIRRELESAFTFPHNTKMEPYGKKNWGAAFKLEILPEQLEFVCGPKTTIAMSAAYRDERLFVETENGRAVGLLSLCVNPKQEKYHISIVTIDKRFQHRGFGKVMLRFAVDYLKKAGAKKLVIGVDRYNIPAQKLYKSVGFSEDCVYDNFIEMSQEL